MKNRSAYYWFTGSLIFILLVSGFSSFEFSIKDLSPSDHLSHNPKIVASEDDPENEEICGLKEPECEESSDVEAKRIEIDLERAEQAKVNILLFWMHDCAHCTEVINSLLPEIYSTYGDQVYFYPIELKEITVIDRFYQMAERLGVPKNNIGVPLMIIGDQVLTGNQIDNNLEKLLVEFLQRDHYTFTAIPEFEENLPEFLRIKQVEQITNPTNPTGGNPASRSDSVLLFVGLPVLAIVIILALVYLKKTKQTKNK